MRLKTALIMTALALAAPALADTKQGVDAWQRGDFAAAVATWRPLAIAGDADAQFNLGQAYKLGRGVPADLKQAEGWYRRAALQGHPQAEDNYGLILFENGSRAAAVEWLERSAKRGEPRAQYILATALFNGDFMAKDWPRAYALMTRASSAGLAVASKSLAQMDEFIPLPERQRGLALARTLDAPKPPVAMAAAAPKQVAVTPKPVAPKPVAVAAKAPALPAPAKPVAASGGWRVQLGAFGVPGNARNLWASLQPRIATLKTATPAYVERGKLTLLQAGPFASRSDAERQCAAIKATGAACLTVPPA